jgi:hypothetical protein
VGQVDVDLAEQFQAADAGAGGDEVVGDPAGVEDLQGAGVDRERAGQVGLVDPPFEDHAVHTGLGQVTGEQQAGRSGSDDQYVSRGGHRFLLKLINC